MKLNANDYVNLLTSEHKKPKSKAWTRALALQGEAAMYLADSVTDSFLIDSAIGRQLDTLGEYIGVSRELNFQPSDGSSPIMNDESYRTVLKAGIARNNWDGRNGSMSKIWADIFSDSQLSFIDNQDMTMTAFVSNLGKTPLLQELIKYGYIIPKPQSVRLKMIFRETIEIPNELAVCVEIMDFASTSAEEA